MYVGTAWMVIVGLWYRLDSSLLVLASSLSISVRQAGWQASKWYGVWPEEMKCVVKFSCSLVGGTSLLAPQFSSSLFHISLRPWLRLLPQPPMASTRKAGSSHRPPSQPPASTPTSADGYVGVTPGLKAFPSCLIDNNALARTFLPGRAGTTCRPEYNAATTVAADVSALT